VFDRYYRAEEGAAAVLVDVILAGAPRDEQETANHCAVKRQWTRKARVKYLVPVDGDVCT
jgi:hypothetical protein